MASYKLAKYILLRNLVSRNKCLPCLLVSDRHFCSKNDKSKTSNTNSEDSSLKKKELHEKSVEAETSSTEPKTSNKDAKAAAKEKLMSLLSNIKVVTDEPVKTTSNLKLAKPLKRVSKKERLEKIKAEMITTEKKKIDMAIKAVASSFNDNSDKIESDLTEKVSSLNISEVPLVEKEASNEEPQMDKLSENLMSSVEEVADTISESPIPPRLELTKRLMRLTIDQNLSSEKKSMRSVIKGLVIESQLPVPRAKPVIQMKQEPKRSPRLKELKKINLFDTARLNIFTPGGETKEDSTNTFWRELEKRELRLLTQFAPANAFEEMIMWTEQGKHWKFPIDNQAEMGEEEQIGFHEHVFLERHLKGFPTKGPIRQFMELVAVGLSKNPYITVDRKIENIEWFRAYFKEKENLLREEGVIE